MPWKFGASIDDCIFGALLLLALIDAVGLCAVVWHGAVLGRSERPADVQAPRPLGPPGATR